jgi:predicted transcriptional regulator
MRIRIDIPDDDAKALMVLARQMGLSRAALVRLAVSEFVQRHQSHASQEGFGLWEAGEDGLAYQERIRTEW